jgi:hypothetical protein
MLDIPADTRIRMILAQDYPFGSAIKEKDDKDIRQPEISTGWWDDQTSRPQITVTNPSEGVLDGGSTGYTSGTGTGGVGRIWTGYALVNAWVKDSDVRSRATQSTIDAGRASGKQVSYMLARNAASVITDYANGYYNPTTGEVIFRSMGVDDVERTATPEQDDLYRYEFSALFNHADTSG